MFGVELDFSIGPKSSILVNMNTDGAKVMWIQNMMMLQLRYTNLIKLTFILSLPHQYSTSDICSPLHLTPCNNIFCDFRYVRLHIVISSRLSCTILVDKASNTLNRHPFLVQMPVSVQSAMTVTVC